MHCVNPTYNKLSSFFLVFFVSAVKLEAIDFSFPNVSHPQGIVSSTSKTVVNIDGPSFHISGGIQNIDTVLHQFNQFNLHQGEHAVFYDAGFKNTVAQIIGTDYSWINGKITSDSNHFFLLNPNGIMFGPGASLDIAGSFYASTAD